MYSTVVVGLSKEILEEKLAHLKQQAGVRFDHQLPAQQLEELCGNSRRSSASRRARSSADPWSSSRGDQPVFRSWNAEKAVTYRRVEKITDLKGTGVNVQQMVFGNMGDDSGTGVCFTRDPSSGETSLRRHVGERAGRGRRRRHPHAIKLSDLQERMPAIYDSFARCAPCSNPLRRDAGLEFTLSAASCTCCNAAPANARPRRRFASRLSKPASR